ncbi:MAG: hypothetical protein NTY22_07965, partial [Proteobacteria bacterium]|nr:hypothetical protein [Pseudomonadota bacterium]
MIDWVKVILADIFHKNYVAKHESKLDEVLEEVIEWLLRAQKYSNTGGFSCVYAILYGWRKPYRETTGYIIPTLLTY